MPKVADYKILREIDFSLTSIGDSMAINFEFPPGALLLDNAQRPFLMFSESAGGAGPLVVELELNGTVISTDAKIGIRN